MVAQRKSLRVRRYVWIITFTTSVSFPLYILSFTGFPSVLSLTPVFHRFWGVGVGGLHPFPFHSKAETLVLVDGSWGWLSKTLQCITACHRMVTCTCCHTNRSVKLLRSSLTGCKWKLFDPLWKWQKVSSGHLPTLTSPFKCFLWALYKTLWHLRLKIQLHQW